MVAVGRSEGDDKRPDAVRRGFFAVDRRVWAHVCGLGMNATAAYLVLARGTGADNRTTAWSTNAIETYTSISRGRSRKALDVLQEKQIVECLRDGTRPKYHLSAAHQIPGCGGHLPPALDELEQTLFERLCGGESRLPSKGDKNLGGHSPRSIIKGLVQKGWARSNGGHRYEPIQHDLVTAQEPDWIWLPNDLVTGATNETPPLELVRQTQDVMTLRLLVDLYHAQNLREDGGVRRTHISQQYKRFEVGRQAEFMVWGFRYESGWVKWTQLTRCHHREELTEQEIEAGKNQGVDYFRREQQLTNLGLIEWVPMLVESDDLEAENIHPLGWCSSDSLEDQIGQAAHAAGASMLTERQCEWAIEENELHLVPVPRHIANVRVIGIARLRYRPHTKATSAWWAEHIDKGQRYLERYQAIAERACTKVAASG